MEWIIGFGLVGYVFALDLWLCWYIGDYRQTGRRGWRRIPAGAWLAYDIWCVRVNRWVARQNRRRDG